MKISSNGLQFEVLVDEPSRPSSNPETVLLTMGLGMQLIAWPDSLIQGLRDAGYRVVRYDNRDIGLSTHLDEQGLPNMPWQLIKHKLGWVPTHPYSLQDMAEDALGLLDALGVARAHLVGVSMGGMISQRLAATYPQRVLSLASIMSSSGAPGLPGPRSDVARYLLTRPASLQPADLVAHSMGLVRLVGGTTFADDLEHVRQRTLAAIQRSVYPQGLMRQTLAAVADTTRHELLGRIACPTLVLHGTADPLVPLVCGEDTARRIPGAQFHAIEGMGHDWPPALVPVWLGLLLPHLQAARHSHPTSPTP